MTAIISQTERSLALYPTIFIILHDASFKSLMSVPVSSEIHSRNKPESNCKTQWNYYLTRARLEPTSDPGNEVVGNWVCPGGVVQMGLSGFIPRILFADFHVNLEVNNHFLADVI